MNKWIVDSGSSSHITNRKDYFKDFEKITTVINLAKLRLDTKS